MESAVLRRSVGSVATSFDEMAGRKGREMRGDEVVYSVDRPTDFL